MSDVTTTPDDQDYNPPAFPLQAGAVWGGMSLRDYFAARALLVLLANPGHASVRDLARYAYDYADTMLAERAKRGAA